MAREKGVFEIAVFKCTGEIELCQRCPCEDCFRPVGKIDGEVTIDLAKMPRKYREKASKKMLNAVSEKKREQSRIRMRIRAGWTQEEALNTPVTRFSKAVKQINPDTGEVIATYESMTQAGEATELSYQTISSCCRGKTKKAGGFVWRYV